MKFLLLAMLSLSFPAQATIISVDSDWYGARTRTFIYFNVLPFDPAPDTFNTFQLTFGPEVRASQDLWLRMRIDTAGGNSILFRTGPPSTLCISEVSCPTNEGGSSFAVLRQGRTTGTEFFIDVIDGQLSFDPGALTATFGARNGPSIPLRISRSFVHNFVVPEPSIFAFLLIPLAFMAYRLRSDL